MLDFERRFGLGTVYGGRHPGAGTANALVALGGRQYLELIAVVDADEASRAQRSGRVGGAVKRGDTFATWVLRTDDLEGLRADLGETGEIMPGARERPDGTVLRWRTLDLQASREGSGIPFLISWDGEEHPGGDGAGRVLRVSVEDREGGPLRSLLARVDVDVAVEVTLGEAPRLRAIEIEAGGRRLTIS